MLVVTSDRGRNDLLTVAREGEDPSVKTHTHTHGDTAAQTKKRTLDRDQVVLGHVGARDGALALGTEVLLNDPFLVQMPRLRADHRLLRHLRGNCTEHRVCKKGKGMMCKEVARDSGRGRCGRLHPKIKDYHPNIKPMDQYHTGDRPFRKNVTDIKSIINHKQRVAVSLQVHCS